MEKQTFEEMVIRLERIVEEMEDAAELEKSIALYEEGVKLLSCCNEQLEGYTKKIEQVTDGRIKPFETDGE